MIPWPEVWGCSFVGVRYYSSILYTCVPYCKMINLCFFCIMCRVPECNNIKSIQAVCGNIVKSFSLSHILWLHCINCSTISWG